MSALGDAFSALKKVILLQERIDGLRGDMIRLSGDLSALGGKVYDIDKRVLRIETMIEMTRNGGPPRIEG